MIKVERIITKEYQDYYLIKYIKRLEPTWTKVFIYKLIRKKKLLVNGSKTNIGYKLSEGDLIKYYIFEVPKSTKVQLNFQSLKPLNVIFENENLIIVDKEIGIEVQGGGLSNMNNRLLKHLNYTREGDGWKPSFVHRLDYNTPGLLMGAKNYHTFVQLTNAQKNGEIEKYYKVMVSGLVPIRKYENISCWLLKSQSKNRVRVVREGMAGAKYSETEIISTRHLINRQSSLLEIRLITGRTHQIRAHMRHIGHPVRGDQKYGCERNKNDFPTPALCAYKLKFSNNLAGDKLRDLRGKIFQKENIWFT